MNAESKRVEKVNAAGGILLLVMASMFVPFIVAFLACWLCRWAQLGWWLATHLLK